MAREQVIFDRELPDLFIFMRCRSGARSAAAAIQSRRIAFRTGVGHQRDIVVRARSVPFSENQFDVIVLPHTLEFRACRMKCCARCFGLRPEGRLLISGFNPYSLFGIKRASAATAMVRWSGEFMSLSRVKDWLHLLGFDIVGGQFDVTTCRRRMIVPCGGSPGLNAVAERWWPFAGGVLFPACSETVAGVRLMRPDWARTTTRRRAASAVPTRVTRSTAARNRDAE